MCTCYRWRERKNSANIYLFKFNNKDHQNHVNDVVLVSLLLTLNRFHTLFWCSYCWLWTSKWQLESLILLTCEYELLCLDSLSLAAADELTVFAATCCCCCDCWACCCCCAIPMTWLRLAAALPAAFCWIRAVGTRMYWICWPGANCTCYK